MASLKEVKGRIASVKNTQKITLAMKMVASAKLHRAQSAVERIRGYQYGLESLLFRLTSYGADIEPDFEQNRISKYIGQPSEEEEFQGKVALVIISSNTGMCGAFNANVVKELGRTLEQYKKSELRLFPIGKKVRLALLKQDYKIEGEFDDLADKLTVGDAAALSARLMELYASDKVQRVEVIYHRFESMAMQRITKETYLPLLPVEPNPDYCVFDKPKTGLMDNYFFEPSRDKIITSLIPSLLHLKLRSALLEAHASEHGARTVAMQMASDNANDLLDELQMQYNKLRQEGITTELLDIIGGSFA